MPDVTRRRARSNRHDSAKSLFRQADFRQLFKFIFLFFLLEHIYLLHEQLLRTNIDYDVINSIWKIQEIVIESNTKLNLKHSISIK